MSSTKTSDIDAIVPGNIFQDDVPPPSLSDGGVSDPQQTYTPPTNGHTIIEVNKTIQIVLISLGVAVVILIILGIAAAYYISHKNKKAHDLKEKQEEDVNESSAAVPENRVDLEKVGHIETNANNGRDSRPISQFNFQEGDNSSSEAGSMHASGIGYSRPSTPGIDLSSYSSHGSGVNPFSTPNGSQFGTPGLGSGSVGPGGSSTGRPNNRSSIIDVANVYNWRQSMIDPIGTSQSASAYHDTRQSFYYDQQNLNQNQQDGSYNATVGSSSSTSGVAASSILLDPFKTNNNSTASLNRLTNKTGQIGQQQNSSAPHIPMHNGDDSTSSSGHSGGGGGSIPSEDWQHRNDGFYTGAAQQTSNPEVADGDISYQPPSAPTSPIQTKPSSSIASPRTGFRNGAAVFEGVSVPRSARPSLDESEAGNVIVSLPSPRGCLLEAAEERGGGEHGQEYILDQQDLSGALHEYGLHQKPDHPSFQSDDGLSSQQYQAVTRRAKHINDKSRGIVRSTYLDDYREQQQQQQDSSGFAAGRRLSKKFLQRISLYSPSPADNGTSDITKADSK
ncbi:hypothetical protein BGZ76_002984 [Entomortierella beljakovae]|nr:hypothetical protein BGZ76_002984 [Entomortierella beljakovae]